MLNTPKTTWILGIITLLAGLVSIGFGQHFGLTPFEGGITAIVTGVLLIVQGFIPPPK
jgi:hypothetical protein